MIWRFVETGLTLRGKLGDRRAVEPLTAKLKSRDRHLRRIAAHALGKLGEKEAVIPLIEILCNQDEDDQVQLAAVRAWGRLGDPRAVRILAHLADREKSRLQAEASLALEKPCPDVVCGQRGEVTVRARQANPDPVEMVLIPHLRNQHLFLA